MTNQPAVRKTQPTATTAAIYPTVQLIPPLADGFTVYGGDDVVERARAWALAHHYLLADGLPRCVHGFYAMQGCPASCYGTWDALDHVNLWVPETYADGAPFLLSHPYVDPPDVDIRPYAAAHGLRVDVNRPGDRWHNDATCSVRLTPQDNDCWVWPIELHRMTLLSTQPVKWPDDDALVAGWDA